VKTGNVIEGLAKTAVEFLRITVGATCELLRHDLDIVMEKSRQSRLTVSFQYGVSAVAWAACWVCIFYGDMSGDNLWGTYLTPAIFTGCTWVICCATETGSAAESYSRLLAHASLALLLLYALGMAI
jgi:hypothetical protein